MILAQIGMDEVLAMDAANSEQAYKDFKDKFKPKKTTDDCYTPQLVYDAVAQWVAKEYGVNPEVFVRPFWPGGDYQEADYPDGCTVVDNPPFSILAEIVRFYAESRIRFFLFAPALTLFSARNVDVTYLAAGCDITYANGAEVKTSFITNLDSCRVRTCPELFQMVKKANDENLKATGKPELPKYDYPFEVITAAMVQRWTRYGIDFRVAKDACVRVSGLDAQKETGKAIYGGGYLLSERAAAERAAAERAAAERAAAERAAAERAAAERAAATTWKLSERERRIIAGLA